MDTEKIILEIHGEVKATSSMVSHIMATQKELDGKVSTLHTRVDGQDKVINDCKGKIFKGQVMTGGIGFVLGVFGHWIKAKVFGI